MKAAQGYRLVTRGWFRLYDQGGGEGWTFWIIYLIWNVCYTFPAERQRLLAHTNTKALILGFEACFR